MACAARRNPPVHQPSCWFVVGKSATHEGRMRVGKRCLGDVNSPNSSTTNFLSAGCTRLSTISVSCAGSHAPGFSSPKMSTSGILIGSSSTANASRTISTAAHETSLSTCPWNVNRCSGSAKLSEFGSAAQVDEALCDGTAYARNANLPQDEDSEYWSSAVRIERLRSFFAVAPPGLLRSPFCDLSPGCAAFGRGSLMRAC